MLDSVLPDPPNENRLLSALPVEKRGDFPTAFENVSLTRGQIIDLRGIADYIYFPVDSIISITSPMKDAPAMELAMVGRESLTGIHALLGLENNWERGIVRIPGEALRIKKVVLRRRLARDVYFSALLMRYFHALHTQIVQAALCYRLHKVRERLQTWLSMMFSRTKNGTELELKHEEIAATLGYHRPTISNATAALQKERVIRYSRGRIHLLDREMLALSCECHQIMELQYAQIAPGASLNRPLPVNFMEHDLLEIARECINQFDSSIRRIREICRKNDIVLAHQKELFKR